MCIHNQVAHSVRVLRASLLAANIAGEGEFLHASTHACLFECLKGRRLSMGQAWFRTSFGEGPTTAARLYQQKFNLSFSRPEADRGNLLGTSKLAQLRQSHGLGGCMRYL